MTYHLFGGALLAPLTLTLFGGAGLAGGDLFDDDYRDCPAATRLRSGEIADLTLDRDPEAEDEVHVSWAVTDASAWGLVVQRTIERWNGGHHRTLRHTPYHRLRSPTRYRGSVVSRP